ncbi:MULTISPECIES: hypothetical protein [unclassified Paraburkholderia]|uniref:hypothetical protein n=1 Tax=unclassified Paraburkholderia TaxID=2615204 RepID=UPI002AAF47E2|nr:MULTISPECIES: hypothetical protein [unclassified Paraburkholderia]
MDVTKQEIEGIHKIVVALTTRKLGPHGKSRAERWFDNAERILASHSIAILLAVLGLLLGSWLWEREWLQDAALTAAVLVVIWAIVSYLIMVGGAVPFFNKLRKDPFSTLHRNIEASTLLDLPEMLKLLQFRHEAVSVYLMQYRHERDSFEKRMALISGALDKIGFFPALAAFFSVGFSIWQHSQTLFRVLVFLVPAFYILAFLSWRVTQEMNRTITIIEHCLEIMESKSEKNQYVIEG